MSRVQKLIRRLRYCNLSWWLDATQIQHPTPAKHYGAAETLSNDVLEASRWKLLLRYFYIYCKVQARVSHMYVTN